MNLETALADADRAGGRQAAHRRSRNDQVATDLRLWTRRAIGRLDAALVDLERALVGPRRARGRRRSCPGTTHIQPAQPVLFAHHLLAYVEMLERDRGRLADARRRLNVSARWAPGRWPGPAIRSTARRPPRELGFDGVTANSLDAVCDRDFVVEVLAAVALGDGPPLPARRGDHLVVEPARSGSCARPTRSRRAPR